MVFSHFEKTFSIYKQVEAKAACSYWSSRHLAKTICFPLFYRLSHFAFTQYIFLLDMEKWHICYFCLTLVLLNISSYLTWKIDIYVTFLLLLTRQGDAKTLWGINDAPSMHLFFNLMGSHVLIIYRHILPLCTRGVGARGSKMFICHSDTIAHLWQTA